MEQTNRLIKKALALAWFTIAFNLLEGMVSIYFGISDEAVSLIGFGGDSLIEVASAFLVLWRLKGEMGHGDAKISLERERRATFGIGALFILLALVTIIASGVQLWSLSHPATTLPGLIIASVSLSFMYFLYAAKRNVAIALNSATIMKDADCSMACIKLSGILFIGSLIYILFPELWWADSVAALGLAGLIGKEGVDTIRATRQDDFHGGCDCND